MIVKSAWALGVIVAITAPARKRNRLFIAFFLVKFGNGALSALPGPGHERVCAQDVATYRNGSRHRNRPKIFHRRGERRLGLASAGPDALTILTISFLQLDFGRWPVIKNLSVSLVLRYPNTASAVSDGMVQLC